MKLYSKLSGDDFREKMIDRHIYITKVENKWLKDQAAKEYTTASLLVRKCIQQYKDRI